MIPAEKSPNEAERIEARGMEGQQVEIQPRHLVGELKTIIADTFPKDIHFEISTPDRPWTVKGEFSQRQSGYVGAIMPQEELDRFAERNPTKLSHRLGMFLDGHMQGIVRTSFCRD